MSEQGSRRRVRVGSRMFVAPFVALLAGVSLAAPPRELGEAAIKIEKEAARSKQAIERARKKSDEVKAALERLLAAEAARDADAAQARQRVEVVRRQRDRRAERAARVVERARAFGELPAHEGRLGKPRVGRGQDLLRGVALPPGEELRGEVDARRGVVRPALAQQAAQRRVVAPGDREPEARQLVLGRAPLRFTE